jgi:hypothetical protein
VARSHVLESFVPFLLRKVPSGVIVLTIRTFCCWQFVMQGASCGHARVKRAQVRAVNVPIKFSEMN